LSRLRLEGELADVGAADLACTSEETSAYFAMLGRPVSQPEREHLVRKTEGWLAGLRLTALAGQAGQAGTQALVSDYLQEAGARVHDAHKPEPDGSCRAGP
jgi:LuxR family maltose regulon positive regulatory protein